MKTCSESFLILKLIYITLFPVVEAQQLKVWPEVTGYLGQDVTLPCQFIQGPNNATINQVQWDLLQTEEKITITVSNSIYGVDIPESPLKGRVKIAEQALIIKNVEMSDAGLYTCHVTVFPSGSFDGTTNLIVKEQMPLSSGVISAIVIAVMLLVGILAAIAYFIFIRCGSPVRRHVYIDTSSPVDVTRQSVLQDEDVVYSDVKPSRDATFSSSYTHTEAVHGDVTYAEVVVLHQQPR